MVWNKGLTKETDTRVKKYAESQRKLPVVTIYCKLCGKEVQTKNPKQQYCSRSCNYKKFKGRIGWTSGLTKETDERLLRRSEGLKRAWADPEIRRQRSEAIKIGHQSIAAKINMSKAQKEAWSSEERRKHNIETQKIVQNIPDVKRRKIETSKVSHNTAESKARHSYAARHRKISYWCHQSDRHIQMKTQTAPLLQAQGYAVTLEKFVTINGHRYAVDLYAEKVGEVLIFEFGGCRQHKLNDLMSTYPRVYHIPYHW